MKGSASEVAAKLEEIAGHIKLTGRLDDLKRREITQLIGETRSSAKLADYFSPQEIEGISQLSATERLKLGYRLENNAKTKKASQEQDAGDKAA